MSGAARRWLDWFRARRDRRRETPDRSSKLPKEIAAEFSTEELMEFLEGDLYPTQADPAFKERLREDLWSVVDERYGKKGPDGDKG